MRRIIALGWITGALAILTQTGGCPTAEEFIPGGTGEGRLVTTASVTVFSPSTDRSITGGTPVEINWIAEATTVFSSVDVFFDPDTTPDNDNEIVIASGLAFTETNFLADTAGLNAGTYFVGVRLNEEGVFVATDYAPGAITVNQASQLFFTSPRENMRFDRTSAINPRFDVAWQLNDPDSTVTVEIFLDPDDSPNGNEIKLFESDSQTGDSFTFDLPSDDFEAGTYRVLALVSDGVEEFAFYSPAAITLRSRFGGVIDLRDLGKATLAGAVFEGHNLRDNLGSFVSSLRDLNGDGFSDIHMMAQFGKPQFTFNLQRTGIGEAYTVYGRADRFSGAINVNSIGTLIRGENWEGIPETTDPIRPSRGITSFTLLSDWDSDGFPELAFGLPFTDSIGREVLDVDGYFRTGCVIIVSSSTLRPDLGFPGNNVIFLDQIGVEPHAPQFEDPQCPHTFYNPKSPTGGVSVTLTHRHIPGAQSTIGQRLGCRFSSLDFGDQFGEQISAFEFDSIIMSAPNRDPFVCTNTNFNTDNRIPGAGVVSIYYCDVRAGFYPWGSVNAPGVPADPVLFNNLPHDGPYMYIVEDMRPFAVPGVGGGTLTEEASPGYLVDADNSDPCIMISHGDLPTVDRTVRIWGQTEGGRLGNALGVDDFTGDGLQDLLVGNPLSSNGAGAVYLVPGRLRDIIWGGEIRVEELAVPVNAGGNQPERIFNGIQVAGAPGERLGQSQDSAGDFNGDGLPDVVIGSPLLNERRGGAAVFFGSRDVINLTQTEIPFTEIDDRGLGVIFAGDQEGDLAGARVAGAGDVDGDGVDDILIAAPNKSITMDTDLDGVIEIDRKSCGAVYLVYGSPDLSGTLQLADIGTDKLPGAMFIGRDSRDFLGAGLGEQGDRSNGIAAAGDVDGDGNADLLFSSVSAAPRDRVGAGEVYLIYGVGGN